jgi:hypothetical protein
MSPAVSHSSSRPKTVRVYKRKEWELLFSTDLAALVVGVEPVLQPLLLLVHRRFLNQLQDVPTRQQTSKGKLQSKISEYGATATFADKDCTKSAYSPMHLMKH